MTQVLNRRCFAKHAQFNGGSGDDAVDGSIGDDFTYGEPITTPCMPDRAGTPCPAESAMDQLGLSGIAGTFCADRIVYA